MLAPSGDEAEFPFDTRQRCSTNDECDEEICHIASKLRSLNERRWQMVRRWNAGQEPAPPAAAADDSTWSGGQRGPERRTRDTTTAGQPSPTQRMNDSMTKLRSELASLFSQDTAIFENLLVLRQSIAQLKQQSYDDLYEDAEVTYLSSNGGSFRFRRDGSTRQGSTRGYSNFTPVEAEQNCEDSGISLVSSGLSSPSLSPSPTSATGGALPLPAARGATDRPDPTAFTPNNVTFPPSRSRQPRSGSSELARSKGSSVSTPSGVDSIGNCVLSEFTKPLTSSRSRKSYAEVPPVLLVRSRSITFLPRGVLVRRETKGEFGVASQPEDGEVFV